MLSRERWESHIRGFVENNFDEDSNNSKVLIDLDKMKRRFALSFPFSLTPIIRYTNFSHLPMTVKFFRETLKSGIILDLCRDNEELKNLRSFQGKRRGRKPSPGYFKNRRASRDFKDIISQLSPFPTVKEFRAMSRTASPFLVSSPFELHEIVLQSRYSNPLNIYLSVDWQLQSPFWSKIDYNELFQFLDGHGNHRLVGIFISAGQKKSSSSTSSNPRKFIPTHERKRKKPFKLSLTQFQETMIEVKRLVKKIRSLRGDEEFQSIVLGQPFTSCILKNKNNKHNRKKKKNKSIVESILNNIQELEEEEENNNNNNKRRRRRRRKIIIFGEVTSDFISDCFCCVSKIMKIQNNNSFYPINKVYQLQQQSGLGYSTNINNKYRRIIINDGILGNFSMISNSLKNNIFRGQHTPPIIGSLKVFEFLSSSSSSVLLQQQEEQQQEKKKKKKICNTDIVGPSGDPDDVICKNIKLSSSLKTGDLLYFPEFGDCFCGNFRFFVGLKKIDVIYISNGKEVVEMY